jgi:glutathione S-transferase
MGDICVGVYVYRWNALDVKRPRLPRVEAYYERLKGRPAFQKHIMKPLT